MMRRKQIKQTDSEKLSLILGVVSEINQKVDKQNAEIEALRREVVATKKLVDEMTKKNRKHAIAAGAIGGGVVAVGFELIRLKLGM